MRNKGLFASISLFFLSATAIQAENAFYRRTVRVIANEYGTLEVVQDQKLATDHYAPFAVHSSPQTVIEHAPAGKAELIELSGSDDAKISAWLKEHHVKPQGRSFDEEKTAKEKDESRTIVDSGPVGNRINLVFMGDGYTEDEKEKFFADVSRLVKDMFVGKTFTSYLPLFNVHAVFRASKTSGIGMGSANDTAYGLYREGETLRAIFPSNRSALRSSCKAAPACDYPVVIANDQYYGGLGGEFAISTSSPTSGSIVLRHELGHNFGKVGEEYDGGSYFGANFGYNASSVKWASNWATLKPVTKEPMYARHLSWPWYKLDKGPKTVTFNSDGKQANTWIRISASGIETPGTLSIKLDDQYLLFPSPNRLDRSFINIPLPALSEGKHTLEFAEHVDDHNNWLSSLTVHEYASDFHNSSDFIGAFPVFAEDLSLEGYRPTDESCLMRDMEHPFFCPICQENNWLKFFDQISLIDSVTALKENDQITVNLSTVNLGQFRNAGTGREGEQLDIHWYSNDEELVDVAGKRNWTKPASALGTSIEVRIKFLTREIRAKEITAKKTVTLKI